MISSLSVNWVFKKRASNYELIQCPHLQATKVNKNTDRISLLPFNPLVHHANYSDLPGPMMTWSSRDGVCDPYKKNIAELCEICGIYKFVKENFKIVTR